MSVSCWCYWSILLSPGIKTHTLGVANVDFMYKVKSIFRGNCEKGILLSWEIEFWTHSHNIYDCAQHLNFYFSLIDGKTSHQCTSLLFTEIDGGILKSAAVYKCWKNQLTLQNKALLWKARPIKPIWGPLSLSNKWPYSNGPPYSAAIWIMDNPTQEIDLGVSQWYLCVLERSLV